MAWLQPSRWSCWRGCLIIFGLLQTGALCLPDALHGDFGVHERHRNHPDDSLDRALLRSGHAEGRGWWAPLTALPTLISSARQSELALGLITLAILSFTPGAVRKIAPPQLIALILGTVLLLTLLTGRAGDGLVEGDEIRRIGGTAAGLVPQPADPPLRFFSVANHAGQCRRTGHAGLHRCPAGLRCG